MLSSVALPDTPEGNPNIPYTKTTSTATIRAILPLRFFFIVPILDSRVRAPEGTLRIRGVLLGGHRGDRAFCNLKLQIVRRHSNDDHIVLNGKNNATDPAGGVHSVPRLQALQHLLPLLLPL